MKHIVIYGDSISTRNHGDGGYEELLRTGLKLNHISNFSVGSSGLTRETPDSMLGILEQTPVPEDADLILVWHGTNDWYWGSSMEAFRDGIREAAVCIRKAAPRAVLVWLTPIFRYEMPFEGEEKGEAYEQKNRAGYTLLDYCCQLESSSRQLGFPLLDMHRLSNIHKENMESYLEDQVHPNRFGYERIANIMIQELERFL